MPHKQILYIVVACLALILLAQGYLVLDYFHTTRESLMRESNVILTDIFKRDYSCRNDKLKKGVENGIYPTNNDEITFDLSKEKGLDPLDLNKNLTIAINTALEETIPQNIHTLDSITRLVLQDRNIITDFTICRLSKSGKIIASSQKTSVSGLLSIKTKPLLVNLDSKQSLQLILLNPFGIIVKRMALMLATSFLFAVLCVFAFVKLLRILARQKQLMEVKNDFFGSTTHELKRPVARLRMALDNLTTERVDADRAKKERYWAISKEAVKEMSDNINMIMTLSMAEEGIFQLNITRFDLSKVIRELKEQFTAVKSKPITIQLPDLPEHLFAKGDETHIRQAIANLIDNAVKYSGESVEISIQATEEGHDIRVTITDNGWGIPPEKQELIFQKYTRLKAEDKSVSGFGIGLNYVKTVVEKHGGRIALDSTLNQGSRFALSLPLAC